MRYDAEFYKPEYLKAINSIKRKAYILNSDCSIIKSGVTPQDRDSETVSEVILLKTNNIRNSFLLSKNIDEYSFIDKKINEKMRSTELKPYDVLINIVGATLDVIGRTSFIFEDFPKSNITQAMAFCRVKDNKVQSAYLFAFLSSYYGKVQVCKFARSTGQYNLNLDELSNFLIYLPTFDFQKIISNLISQSYNLIKLSSAFFAESKKILFSELGLTNWKPKHQLSFVRNFSEAEESGRMDAEYYQPKYDEIENAIKGYSGGYSFIKEEFGQNKKSFINDKKQLYQYVEIGSVNITNGEIMPDELSGEELPANAKILLEKDDIVISKVRTYRGAITIIEEDGYIGSGAFTVLQGKHGRINKETLLAFLHSKPILNWTLKPNTGTSYPVITDEDILNLPIPLIPNLIQEEIRQKVSESFTLRRQAKHLLECAKRAVEIAIEQDEQTAIEWLEKETA
jgi:type I restriction enzyme S subunit